MNTLRHIAAAGFLVVILTPVMAGDAIDVAPKAEGTRIQQWPRAAWSETAKCWLVAWREGDVTEEKAEIWCARVAADGKALDPAGIRLAKTGTLADHPCVASDGKDFLVVWEDLRNGADPSTGSGHGWDVYGARVTSEGKAAEENGFLIAGGAHNQCRPASAFCKGSYAVAFLSFEGKGAPGAGQSGYVLRSVRVSPDGKLVDDAPVALSDTKMKLKVWNPIAAAGTDGVLVAAYDGEYGPDYKSVGISAGVVAMPDGKPVSPVARVGALLGNYANLCLGNRLVHHPPGAAWTGSQFLVCVPSGGSAQGAGKPFKGKDCVVVCSVDAQGKSSGDPEFTVFARERLNSAPCVSLAFDGERCLVTEDVIIGQGRGAKNEVLQTQVLGCFLAPDGKPLGDGKPFSVSNNPARTYCSQGFAASGPKGCFLAVWSAARGIDNVKVAARVIK